MRLAYLYVAKGMGKRCFLSPFVLFMEEILRVDLRKRTRMTKPIMHCKRKIETMINKVHS